MNKFNIGDKVIVMGHRDDMTRPCINSNKDIFNLIGTICNVHYSDWADGTTSYGIKFEENIGGHDCCGKCEYGYGQSINEKYLKLYNEKKVRIKLCRKRNMKRNHWSSRLKRNTKVSEMY